MKTDFSRLLFEEYYSHSNPVVELTLINGQVLSGVVCGFFKGDPDMNEPFIARWHMLHEPFEMKHILDALYWSNGMIVEQEEIRMVKFPDDGFVLSFGDEFML